MAAETKTIPGVKDVMTNAGGSSSNTGNLYVSLDNWDQRTASAESVTSIITQFNMMAAKDHPEASIYAFNVSSLPGLGMEGGWSMQLQDNLGLSDTELSDLAAKAVAACNARPELMSTEATTVLIRQAMNSLSTVRRSRVLASICQMYLRPSGQLRRYAGQ